MNFEDFGVQNLHLAVVLFLRAVLPQSLRKLHKILGSSTAQQSGTNVVSYGTATQHHNGTTILVTSSTG